MKLLISALVLLTMSASCFAESLVNFSSEKDAGFWRPIEEKMLGEIPLVDTISMKVNGNNSASIFGYLRSLEQEEVAAAYAVKPENKKWTMSPEQSLTLQARSKNAGYFVFLRSSNGKVWWNPLEIQSEEFEEVSLRVGDFKSMDSFSDAIENGTEITELGIGFLSDESQKFKLDLQRIDLE